MNTKFSLVIASLSALGAGFYACGGDEDSRLTDNNNGPGPGASTGTNTAAGGQAGGLTTAVGGNFTSSASGSGGACADDIVEPMVDVLPADIIVIIDNSGSMTQELAGVEQNINTNFANILNSAMLDYQVIMITDHGDTTYDICVGPPLSNTTNCAGPPVEVPMQFYHYDVNVQSTDGLCIALETMYGSTIEPDESNPVNTMNGWAPWLRPNAKKFFLFVTDDRMYCAWMGTQMYDNVTTAQYPQPGQNSAVLFDQLLLQQAPTQFGTTANRNYIFYAITGLAAQTPNNLDPWPASAPYVTTTCGTGAVNVGPGYQWLAKGTYGWRYPVCQYNDYSSLFQKFAQDVITVTGIDCVFPLPTPPPGFTLDPSTVEVIYTPDAVNPVENFTQVASAAACNVDDDKFYIENGEIHLCPAACARIQANHSPDQDLQTKVACGFIPA